MPIIKNIKNSINNSNINLENINRDNKKLKKIILVFVLLVVAGLVGVGYFYPRYKIVNKNPEVLAKEEVESILGKLGKLMILPADETPTVATITDKEKLASQPFFSNAQNGDKLIVYARSKKAILFREKGNIIVEVAPVYFNNNPAASAPAN